MRPNSKVKTWFVIRSGWNSANQSAVGRPRNPRNKFESGLYKLVAVVDAVSEQEAIAQADCTVYHNQYLFAVSSVRYLKGLTEAERAFYERVVV